MSTAIMDSLLPIITRSIMGYPLLTSLTCRWSPLLPAVSCHARQHMARFAPRVSGVSSCALPRRASARTQTAGTVGWNCRCWPVLAKPPLQYGSGTTSCPVIVTRGASASDGNAHCPANLTENSLTGATLCMPRREFRDANESSLKSQSVLSNPYDLQCW